MLFQSTASVLESEKLETMLKSSMECGWRYIGLFLQRYQFTAQLLYEWRILITALQRGWVSNDNAATTMSSFSPNQGSFWHEMRSLRGSWSLWHTLRIVDGPYISRGMWQTRGALFFVKGITKFEGIEVPLDWNTFNGKDDGTDPCLIHLVFSNDF